MAQAHIKGMYLRGSTWWFRYTPAPNAAQVRESLGTSNESVAAAAALEILRRAPIERGCEFDSELARYLSAGAASRMLAPATVQARRIVLEGFAKDCEVKRLADIRSALIQGWIAILRGRGIEPQSIGTYLVHLQAFCSAMVKGDKMRSNPAKGVSLGKLVAKGRTTFATKDKVSELLAAAPDDEMRFILYAGFDAGMRKLEIMEARPDWFLLSDGARRGCVRVQETPTYRPKDKEERTIPLTARFEAFLREYLATLPPGAIWMIRPFEKKNPSPKVLYRISFVRRFREFMRVHGTPCTPHDMRRSFVSNRLIDDSSLIFKLAKWTGTDVQTLQKHYAHLLADDADIEAGV